MKYQNTFKRYEVKFLLNQKQKEAVLKAIEGRMVLDEYGKTSVRNIYYDTPNFYLVRKSMEKPMYKEKLRIRCYGDINHSSDVFVEIKKKFDDVVYKRRVALPLNAATTWLSSPILQNMVDSQIGEEIDYFKSFYQGLRPTCYLSYDRCAYKDLNGEGLRLTMDSNVMARLQNLSLLSSPEGERLIPEDMTLMEFKTPGSIPLWLIKCLEENQIRQNSFSKYGKAYMDLIFNNVTTGGNTNV